ncbi:MAG: thioesterase-like protein [Rhodospirillaceae bacterium]|nr:thioesterase-like protein [Rhodospirillaceae bacterium]
MDLGDLAVRSEWIDYSGHMNIGYYLLAFELRATAFFEPLDLSRAYRERTDNALFSLETHIAFLREVREGATLRFDGQLLGHDAKRVRAFYRMFDAEEGYLAAINEVMYVHIDLDIRRSAPLPPDRAAALDALWAEHKDLPWPGQAGRGIGFSRKK